MSYSLDPYQVGHFVGPDLVDFVDSVVVDFLFIVTPIVGVCNCSMFCYALLYVHSRIAIILMGKRELVALLNLSSWCLVVVGRLFLAVPWGCLQFVIVVFPDHTHYFWCQTVRKCYQKTSVTASRQRVKHKFGEFY